MRSKLILTKDDVKDRFAFSKESRNQAKKWWLKIAQRHLDSRKRAGHTPTARDATSQPCVG